MKTFKATPNRRNHAPGARGFALIVVITVLSLVTIMVVGMLSLSSVASRRATNDKSIAVARSNARLSMQLALGALQTRAGADQRTTFASALEDPAAAGAAVDPNVEPGFQQAWAGVVAGDDPASPPRWLVSGENPNPAAMTASNSTLLASNGRIGDKSGNVRAPLVTVRGAGQAGRLAYWVGDEGVKARVDLAKTDLRPANDRERYTRSQSAQENGIANVGGGWAAFAAGSGISKDRLINLETAALALPDGQSQTLAGYLHDLTTGGLGLPTNQRDGGMKADLSVIFDRSQRGKRYATEYMGATATALSHNGANIINFTPTTGAAGTKFYLSETYGQRTPATGPNWGNLWNYATLWQNVVNSQIPVVGAYPVPDTDLRWRDWLPYRNSGTADFRRDRQHINSAVTPVISLIQIGFRLKARIDPATAALPDAQKRYIPQVEMKPVIGLWNPYNVAIRQGAYSIDWALYPFFRLNYAHPATGAGSQLTEVFLREYLNVGPGQLPSETDALASSRFSVQTEEINLQPGEFRMFSVTEQIQMGSAGSYKLKPAWSERGAFVVDLQRNNAAFTIPAGHVAWFGDIVLQETQSTRFKEVYGTVTDVDKIAGTWFTLKSATGNVLLRSTDLWNGHSTKGVLVPEPVVSGWKGGSSVNTTKQKFRIEDLARPDFVAHIATWSFFSRTSTQMAGSDANQVLRNWIDSNPRALAVNPAWDGSSVNANGDRTGWHLASPLMGGTHPPAARGEVGDGFGGNRGMIAEGGIGEPEPQSFDKSRYQGFGGASNTVATGQTHAAIFDVPRAPLVSIGQFQHAQLGRYNFDPGFVAGNSYANPRIPLDRRLADNFAGVAGMTVADLSLEVNEKLWDGYFFSTLAPDHVSLNQSTYARAFDFAKLISGEITLPNPRMEFVPMSGDTAIEQFLTATGNRGPEAMAARIRVRGAFNVNSTSKTAWKAFLSSLGSSELPTLNVANNTTSWSTPGGIRFNRFGTPATNQPHQADSQVKDPGFWRGWRAIDEATLDALAEAMVAEVKLRGPFRSLADFVNRDPDGTDVEARRKGALQAALDKTVNKSITTDFGLTATTEPAGSHFSDAFNGENATAGFPGYVLQGDVLQSLAPVMQARSDYFRIRASGEAQDGTGRVIGRAWCEALVQRSPDYVDTADAAHLKPTETTSAANRWFGRKFELVSFRWLDGSEL